MPKQNYTPIVTPAQSNTISNLELALQLASRGWFVFPCNPDKTPRTRNGFKNATTDPAIINSWGAMWQGGLIGIACQKSGFFAVDIDAKNGHDGFATWNELQNQYTGGVATEVGSAQATPSGGSHLLFAWPEGLTIPNNAGKLGEGLDLRSNGYICTGGAYRWLDDHGPEVELVPAPDWLLELISQLSGIAQSAKKPAPATKPQVKNKSRNRCLTANSGDVWLNKALSKASVGNRNQTGFDLACQLRDAGVTAGEAELIIRQFAAQVPQPSGQPYTELEALESLASAYSGAPREPAHTAGNHSHSQPASTQAEKQPIISTWQDMIGLVGPITWAWESWLPDGVLTILAGEPGSGKSALALRLAGCYLRGDPWPDGHAFTNTQGTVIWCEAEAGQALNLQRAKAWGLPLEKIWTHTADPLLDFALANQAHLDALRRRAERPEVQLIIIDSLSGADSKAEKSSEDAASVKSLAELGRDIGKPILLTHHLRKKSMFDGDTIDIERLRGSSAIVQTARMVWALDTPDPNAKNWRRLQVVKSNLAAFPTALGLTVGNEGVKFGLAPSQPKVEGPMDRAIDLLRALLQDEPQPADAIKAEFDGAGISEKTMKRAKARLGIVSRKDKTGWSWSLPAGKDYEYEN